jgi:hypothetical protein
MMYLYFTKQRTHRCIEVLQDIVKSYNATPHRSLNSIAQKDVNKNNEADIWAYMYLKPKRRKKKLRKYIFTIGDLVRISALT